jgi:hypothetical protein
MTDIWYTFGAMVADPGFFPVIAKVNPTFTLIKMTVAENDGPPAIRPAAGYLEGDTTTALRRAFRDYVGANLAKPAPVISLYTAAKFSQLSKTLSTFHDVFTFANRAFVKAGGSKMSSVAMLIAMGVCLLDGQLATAFRAGDKPLPGDTVALTAEFGLQPAEFIMLQAWLNDGDFNTAQTNLMSAACWTTAPCLEDFVFYPGFKRAVN